MKNYFFTVSTVVIILADIARATFSLAAVDSTTGEVGSAGGSCVDYVQYDLIPGRIGDVLPGLGVINTQAAVLSQNQVNARNRMLAGDTPQEIIDWLMVNDGGGDSTIRQYGIVAYNQGNPTSAGFTGSNNTDYKNHILAPHYSIQGNILLDASVLDSMESRFNSEPGGLACKLMAALQGAKRVGADSRCADNGSSTLYSYIKVAQPADTLDNPSLFIGVRTRDGAGIEPVDSLQTLFDESVDCTPVKIKGAKATNKLSIYTNPESSILIVACRNCTAQPGSILITSITGKLLVAEQFTNELIINTSGWAKGLHILRVKRGSSVLIRKFLYR